MVTVEEIPQETHSESRLADAAELESLLIHVKRESLKQQLTQLQIKLQKDAKALKMMENSQSKVAASAAAQVESPGVQDEAMEDVTATPPPAAAVPATNAVATPIPAVKSVAPVVATKKYTSVDTFSFDAGSYGSKTVSVYISLAGVGSIDKSNISCPFTKSSFDLTIHDLKGKNYRLLKDNLDKEIDPEKSKVVIKADRIVIKLAKVKTEYGSYDSWTDLTSKKGKVDTKKKSTDPSASIMDLMKDMYDSGDDNMKKMIGETMMKQREGKLGKGMDDLDYKPGAI